MKTKTYKENPSTLDSLVTAKFLIEFFTISAFYIRVNVVQFLQKNHSFISEYIWDLIVVLARRKMFSLRCSASNHCGDLSVENPLPFLHSLGILLI